MAKPGPPSVTAAEFDRAARQLYASARSAGRRASGFTSQLDAALSAIFALLRLDPKLRERIAATPAGEASLAAQMASWQQRFAELLREAATADPSVSVPAAALEPELIAGLAFRLRAALGRPLGQRLLIELRSSVIYYYREASQIQRYMNACGHRPRSDGHGPALEGDDGA